MNAVFFKGNCRDCGNNFEFPVLSDFEYGRLIAASKQSPNFFIVNLLNNPVADFIGQKRSDFSPKTFQQIVAACTDQSIDNDIALNSFCPVCSSENVEINTCKKLLNREIEEVSYKLFLTLDDKEKTKFIESKLSELI